MKSVVQLDINVPRVELAKLFADPANNPKWMDDIERIETLSSTLGDPGSVYRLVPKHGINGECAEQHADIRGD